MDSIIFFLLLLISLVSVRGTFTIQSIAPNFGIYHGGTNVTISIGNVEREEEIIDVDDLEVSVFLIDSDNVSSHCVVVEKRYVNTMLYIDIVTPGVKNESFETPGRLVAIIVRRDPAITEIVEGVFQLKPNPVVEKKVTPFATIVSGGVKVSLDGRNLMGASVIHLWASGVREDGTRWSTREPCEIISFVKIGCRTPKLLISERVLEELANATGDKSPSVNLLLPEMKYLKFFLSTDGLTHSMELPRVYQDPTIRVFSGVQVFVINGENKRIYIEGVWPKNFPTLEENMRISVGGRDCSSPLRENESHVSCVPPPVKSHVIRYGPQHLTLLPVKVSVGHAEYSIGDLKYEEEENAFKSVPIMVMIVLLSFILVSTIVFAILTSYSSRKQRRNFETGSSQARAARGNDVTRVSIINEDDNDNNNNDDDDDDDGDCDEISGDIKMERKASKDVKHEPFEVESLLAHNGEDQGKHKL